MGSPSSTNDAFVSRVALQLGETSPSVIARLAAVIVAVGNENTTKLVRDAEAVRDDGGMKRKDGTMRTLGGIFFQLAKTHFGVDDRRASVGEPPKSTDAGPTKERIASLFSKIAAEASDACKLLADVGAHLHPPPSRVAAQIEVIRSLIATLAFEIRPAPKKKPKRKIVAAPKHRPVKSTTAVRPKKKKKKNQIAVSKKSTGMPYLGYSRPAARGGGRGYIYRPIGGKKAGSHSDGRHG